MFNTNKIKKTNKKYKISYKLHNVDTYRLVIFKLFIVYKGFVKKSSSHIIKNFNPQLSTKIITNQNSQLSTQQLLHHETLHYENHKFLESETYRLTCVSLQHQDPYSSQLQTLLYFSYEMNRSHKHCLLQSP